jgi:starvation-inducible DNA-binding protein
MNSMIFPTMSQDSRERVGSILNQALADEFALSAAARDYHWNVVGPQARSLYELFDEQYHQLDQWIEKIASRARAVGVAAKAGWAELIKAPRFAPVRGAGLTTPCMLAALMALHDCMVNQLRTDVETCTAQFHDAATAELLSELAEYHETTSWMLGELLEDREISQA